MITYQPNKNFPIATEFIWFYRTQNQSQMLFVDASVSSVHVDTEYFSHLKRKLKQLTSKDTIDSASFCSPVLRFFLPYLNKSQDIYLKFISLSGVDFKPSVSKYSSRNHRTIMRVISVRIWMQWHWRPLWHIASYQNKLFQNHQTLFLHGPVIVRTKTVVKLFKKISTKIS